MYILTYNLFFTDNDYVNRINHICKIVKDKNPDVVCFQEVIHPFWIIIKDILLETYNSVYEHPYINNCSDRSYGEVILYKKNLPYKNKGFKLLTSEQGRVCTWVDIGDVRILTSHMESYEKNSLVRKKQIGEILSIANESEKWIWVGDTNMEDNEKPENMYTPFFTYHGSRFSGNDVSKKYDGVWIFGMKIESFEIVGNEKVKNEFWLSDHDGLIVNIN